MVWKRKVLGLEEKPFAVQEKEGRRKYGFWIWKRRAMGGLEEKGFGIGREAVCWYGKKEGRRKLKKRKKIFLVLTPFT